MLTREEYHCLRKELIQIYGEDLPTGMLCALSYISENYTDEPKREIKLGDIYLDTRNVPRQIKKIDLVASYPLIGDRIVYNTEGQSHTGDHNLDLSKCYKLVEIEDAD